MKSQETIGRFWTRSSNGMHVRQNRRFFDFLFGLAVATYEHIFFQIFEILSSTHICSNSQIVYSSSRQDIFRKSHLQFQKYKQFLRDFTITKFIRIKLTQ